MRPIRRVEASHWVVDNSNTVRIWSAKPRPLQKTHWCVGSLPICWNCGRGVIMKILPIMSPRLIPRLNVQMRRYPSLENWRKTSSLTSWGRILVFHNFRMIRFSSFASRTKSHIRWQFHCIILNSCIEELYSCNRNSCSGANLHWDVQMTTFSNCWNYCCRWFRHCSALILKFDTAGHRQDALAYFNS